MIKQVTADTFHDEVYHHDGPVVVTFSSTHCAPCRQQKPVLEQLAATGVKVLKVDVESDHDVAAHFKVTMVPTTLFFARGEPRVQLVGVGSLKKLQDGLAAAVKKGDEAPADHVHA